MEPASPDAGSAGPCPGDDLIARFVEGQLRGEGLRALERHLDGCERCMLLVAELLDDDPEELGLAATRTIGDLDQPIDDLPTPANRLGRYVVLSRLGAGGMGVVYAGYDPQIDRRVALKLVRVDPRDAERRRARLLREARAMGQLSHPNIVNVFDVGTSEAGVFIAMELIAGRTLREWLDERSRPWREIVACFGQAGQGLAAAHDQGLVHRDFKPGNVMVGDDGRVRVLDFGLARRTERPEAASPDASQTMTLAGTIVGTPAYMSPEQIAGVADARSDQFSFCVALHEAIHGERPFAGRSFESLAARVLEGRPTTPSRRASVPNRVQRAIQRGLSVDPAERWPDMRTLLQAIDPPPWRRRALVVAGTAVGLALAVAYGRGTQPESEPPCRGAAERFAASWGPTQRDQMRRAFVASGSPAPEESAHAVESMLEGYGERWATSHTEACEATRLRAEQSDALLDLRMTCLERARREVAAAVDLLTEADAELVARASELVAGLPSPSRCDDVVALRSDLPPPDDPELAREVERVRDLLIEAAALGRAGRFDAALERVRDATEQADALGYGPLRAESRLRAGALHKVAGELDEAEASLTEAYWMARPLGDDRTIIESETMLIALLGQQRQRFDEAHRWARHARADIERTGGSPDHRYRYHRDLGATLAAESRYEDALVEYEPSLALARELYGDHPLTAQALNNLGTAHLRLGELDRALAELTRARTIYERILGPSDRVLVETIGNIGLVHFERGEHELALAHHQHALELAEQAFGVDQARTVPSRLNLGVSLFELDRLEPARAAFARALEIAEREYGPRHTYVATAHYDLGDVARARGRLAEALDHHRRALAIFEAAYGPTSPDLAPLLVDIARSELSTGDGARARQTLDRLEALCRGDASTEGPCVEASELRAEASSSPRTE